MKRVLLAALALSATAIAVPAPASAASGSDTVRRGCFFDTDSQATVTGGQNVGVIGDVSVTTDGSGAPTFARVTCWIIVDGVEAPGTRITASGTGVQAGATTVSFAAGDSELVQLCQQVVYGDGTIDTQCPIPLGDQNWPPGWFVDTVSAVLDVVNSVGAELTAAEVAYVDPVVCPVFAQLAGSYPGGVTVAPDGDLYLPDPLDLWIGPFWDCPPYDNFSLSGL